MDLTAALAGASMGIVIGWLLPIVRRRTWLAFAASGVLTLTVLGAVFLAVGIPGVWGGVAGITVGAWLHATFLEYVAGRSAVPKEE